MGVILFLYDIRKQDFSYFEEYYGLFCENNQSRIYKQGYTLWATVCTLSYCTHYVEPKTFNIFLDISAFIGVILSICVLRTKTHNAVGTE